MELLLVLLKLFFCLAVSSDAANILAIVPFKGRSHFIVIQPLLEGLAERGHNVTVDLQNELDKSEKGIIIFSFGSVVRASSLPASIVDDFIKAFARIDLTVLWKFEGTVGNLPPNVIVRKWIPQIDVIAHPNVKLLITHGGLASIMEAVSHGVPIIGIPMFGDQPSNIQRIVGKGAGLKIDYSEINAETVYNSIQQILLNPTYKSNAEKLSRVFKDRELPPLETAVYWIEYVLRHKGAHHLRSEAQHLSWIELYCLDILAFLIFGTTTFFIVSIKLIKILVKFVIK